MIKRYKSSDVSKCKGFNGLGWGIIDLSEVASSVTK